MQVLAQLMRALWPCILFALLVGCAAPIRNRPEDVRLVTVSGPAETGDHSAPSFQISEWQQPYNRIGKVRAEQSGDFERFFVDPQHSVVYFDRLVFTTERATYTNLVYRIHFAQTPFSLIPFYLTAGNNVGLLVVITLDGENRPLLVTTVNSCGCYVAIIPTSYLPVEDYPADWPEKEQKVYGEILPARLEMKAPDDRLLISIRPAVHRVMDVQVVQADFPHLLQEVVADMQPLSALQFLPLSDGRTTSMYYEMWPLRGHVKGSLKPWESLLLSLFSLDLYVGMDKEYGRAAEGSNPFYTSLKPWNRQASDMNDFAGFLQFHGWKL